MKQNKLVIKNADMNSITLDCAEYRIDGGEWRKQKAVIRIMKELLSAGRNVPVELRFYCDIECNPKKLGPIYLAMETCEKYEVTINKKSFIFVPDGFFRDSAFQKADITGYLTEGKNEILLKTNFYDVILPLFPAYTGAQFMAALFSGLYIGSGCIRYDGRD